MPHLRLASDPSDRALSNTRQPHKLARNFYAGNTMGHPTLLRPKCQVPPVSDSAVEVAKVS